MLGEEKRHLPDIDAIERLDSSEARFYAMVGAVISLAGTFENSMFGLFYRALGIDRGTAHEMFFLIRDSGTRLRMLRAAMRRRIDGDATLLAPWEKIDGMIATVLRSDGPRNLVAHNYVVCRVVHDFIRVGNHILVGPPYPSIGMPIPGDKEFLFAVTEDPARVEQKDRDARRVNYWQLLAYARELVAGVGAVDDFLAKL